jgi:hypothetical protein
MNERRMRQHIERHFAGTIAPSDERAMREHLPGCDACRDLYRRYLVLAGLDPAALPAHDRIARGLGWKPPRVLFHAVVAVPVAALVLCAFLARSGGTAGFSSRGGGVLTRESPRSRVFVYDVGEGQAPAPAGDSVGRRDELAFSYENAAGKRRLMIFGVDEHRRVYWFYPAWTDEADDPVAVPIATDAGRHELPEAIRHDYGGARLEIRSLFLDEPMTVRQIEALMKESSSGPLPIAGAIERSISLAVVP